MRLVKLGTMFLIVLLLMQAIIPFCTVEAAHFPMDRASLYSKEEIIAIKHKDTKIGIAYVVYTKDGVEYPAYCMNRNLDGVEFDIRYDVTIDSYMSNALVWRCITNGFPYVNKEELGAQSDAEAFAITKIATYDMLYNYNWSDFSSLNEQGQRIIDGAKRLSEKARASQEVKPSADLKITCESKGWTIDKLDSTKVSKTYSVSTQAGIDSYTISVSKGEEDGLTIANMQNKAQNQFTANEKFKILMPIKNMEKDTYFDIRAKANVNTKPIYYGKSTIANKQSYALTGQTFELGDGKYSDGYFKNETQLQIVKKDGETGEVIQGAEFNILDENKNVIYSNVITDASGVAILNNMLPGKYYLQEIKSKEGYEIYDTLIPIKLDLNLVYKITVRNYKEEIEYVVTDNKKEQEADYGEKGEKIVKELPRTGF